MLPLKTAEARLFYLGEAVNRQLATRELRRMIDRKAFERKEIANAQLSEASAIALDTFKDPYQLDVLGLHCQVSEGLVGIGIGFVRCL